MAGLPPAVCCPYPFYTPAGDDLDKRKKALWLNNIMNGSMKTEARGDY